MKSLHQSNEDINGRGLIFVSSAALLVLGSSLAIVFGMNNESFDSPPVEKLGQRKTVAGMERRVFSQSALLKSDRDPARNDAESITSDIFENDALHRYIQRSERRRLQRLQNERISKKTGSLPQPEDGSYD